MPNDDGSNLPESVSLLFTCEIFTSRAIWVILWIPAKFYMWLYSNSCSFWLKCLSFQTIKVFIVVFGTCKTSPRVCKFKRWYYETRLKDSCLLLFTKIKKTDSSLGQRANSAGSPVLVWKSWRWSLWLSSEKRVLLRGMVGHIPVSLTHGDWETGPQFEPLNGISVLFQVSMPTE